MAEWQQALLAIFGVIWGVVFITSIVVAADSGREKSWCTDFSLRSSSRISSCCS